MSQPEALLVDAAGRPLRAHAGSNFQAADLSGQELASWRPALSSADGDYFFNRDTIAARTHDIARNDGWASSALQKHLDNAIGSGLWLSAKPDYRALGLDANWADEWSEQVEANWRLFADDPRFYCDATRSATMAGLQGQLYRHRILDGECLAVLLWLPDRGGRNATTVQVIDPDRLSNPEGRLDRKDLRMGVELDGLGAPTAYHIRKQHPGELFIEGSESFVWERVERETFFGRPIVIHDFEKQRAGQTRGVSPLAPIVKKLKQYQRYDDAELGAAVINALLAAFIESPFDADVASGALGEIGDYQNKRLSFHKKSDTHLAGVRIPQLFPGEKFTMNAVARPNSAYESFVTMSLRNFAAALGISYEQLAMDWSKTNYSSARAALLEVWRFFTARRSSFCNQTIIQIYAAWLEEEIELGRLETPPGAPRFQEARAAYCRARWIGPARGWVDPTKEAQGAQMRLDVGLSTLEDECAEQGKDWREVLEQRRREIATMKDMDLPRPAWADQAPAQSQEGVAA